MILFRSIVANDNDSSHKLEGPEQGEDLKKKLQKLLIVLNRGTFVMQNTRPKLFFLLFFNTVRCSANKRKDKVM